MKLITKTLFIITVALLIPPTVIAEHHPKPRLISVSGDAEVRVVPNEVNFTLGIETSNKTLEKAKEENDQRINNVIAVAKLWGREKVYTNRLLIH